MAKKALIATLYNPEPVLLACTRLGPDRLILLIDKEPNKEQEKSLKMIQDSLGRVLDVKTVKTEVYDIVEVAKECVKVIDMQPQEDEVYINITSGRKTKALGLLFAAYTRAKRIKKIAYNPEEDRSAVVYLPRLSFKLNESQLKIIEYIDSSKAKDSNYTDLAKEAGVSQAMFYKAVGELKEMDLLEDIDGGGLKLTDAGKIAKL